MRKSLRLAKLVDVIERREQAAARLFRQSAQQAAAHWGRLEELRQYQTHYRSELLDRGQRGLGAGQLRALQGFLAKLDEAVAQGLLRAARSEERRLRDKQRWLAARTRRQLLAAVMQRSQIAEQALERRIAQQVLDERAQRFPAQGCAWGGVDDE